MSNLPPSPDDYQAALLRAFNEYLIAPSRLNTQELMELITNEAMYVGGLAVMPSTMVTADDDGQTTIDQIVVVSIVGTNWQNNMPIFGRFVFDMHNWVRLMQIADAWMSDNPEWRDGLEEPITEATPGRREPGWDGSE